MDLSWLLLSVRCTNNNIQHCNGFGMYNKTTYNTVILSWLLLTLCQMYNKTWLWHGFCSVSDVQKINNTVMALSWLLLSVRCTKKQHTTLWWLWWLCGFCSVSDVQKNNIQHCDGIVVASAQCQMYKTTIYNTVMALSWLLLSVRCTKKQHTTLWWLCRGFCSVSDVQNNNIQHCDGFVMASAQCQMQHLWVSDVQKNNIQHCDGFVVASAQCQMYKKTIYNNVNTDGWLCHGFCSVSDVQKNNIQHCDGFVMASALCQMYKKTTYNTVMALSWLLLSVRYTKKINIQHCDGFGVASAQCQMYKKTTYNTVMALSWLLLSVRCTKKQYTTLWWLCRGFCSVSDVQKNNIQHCDGFVVASAQCQMYKKTIYNTVMALSWLLLSVRCTKKQYTTLWWLCRGFVMASAQCQMYKKTTYNTVMALSWLLLSVRCTKKQYTTLWWLCHGFCSVSDVQTTIYNTVMALSWLCHGFYSVPDVQKNNIEHCDGFVMASAQCQMYKKTIYNTDGFVMASAQCQMYKQQYTTL